MKTSISSVLCLGMIVSQIIACGASKNTASPIAPAAPQRSLETSFIYGVDPHVARVFAQPPLFGAPPENPTWSPDGSYIAFLRVNGNAGHASGQPTELWIHELASHRERPLFAKEHAPITEYKWCGDKKLVFAARGDIYLVDSNAKATQLTNTDETELSPQCSPDGSRIAFVRNNNLYALTIDPRAEIPITNGGTKYQSFGTVTWVYGEEFRTKSGFGWAPDSAKIWFYWTDEKDVNRTDIVTYTEETTRKQPYPRPGKPNPKVHVGVAHLEKDHFKIVWMKTGQKNDNYLPQVQWHPSSSHLFITRLDRLQTQLDLMSCEVRGDGCRIVYEEHDPRWVNLQQEPLFTKDGKSFLWLSERDGFSHIYKIDSDGSSILQLTEGLWVVRSIDALSEQEDAVYFTANTENPTEYALFRTSLSGGKTKKISIEPGEHKALFHVKTKTYIDTSSSLNRPPRTRIHKIGNEKSVLLNEGDLKPYNAPNVANDLMSIQSSDGTNLMALLTRPLVLQTGEKYPVLIYVYGGPHAQLAVNRFRSTTQIWRNFLASRGILVFSVDGRGSAGRGKEFETPIHRQLCTIELYDQLDGVNYLKTLPFVDQKRIGIFGWSFGGTMALNALLRTKNIFKAGIAVAPVTDWQLYDSAYTERYMQRPEDNPEGYSNTSLIALAYRLEAPLFLAHGLGDDNVHFQNTALLVNKFIEKGKTFELMVYPDKDHSIGGANTRANLFTRILRFLERNL